MRRLLLGLMLGALIFGVSFAGAKLATVTNPMTTNLDAGGYSITNAGNVDTFSGAGIEGSSLVGNTVVLYDRTITSPFGLILAASEDPLVTPPDSVQVPATLYIRRVDATHGELWFKYGTGVSDWVKVAP